MANSMKETYGLQPARYQIRIVGKLRESWSDWFSGMEISKENDDLQPQVTTLIGVVNDQAALRGILCKLWDLNLTILSVARMDCRAEKKESV